MEKTLGSGQKVVRFKGTGVKDQGKSEGGSDINLKRFNILDDKNAGLLDLLYCIFSFALYRISNEMDIGHEIFKFTH